MKSIEELQKEYNELDKEQEGISKQFSELSDKSWDIQQKLNKIQDEITKLTFDKFNLNIGDYYLGKDEPSYHYTIFLTFKITNIDKRNVSGIRYLYREDDGDLSFKVDSFNINKITFAQDVQYYKKITEEKVKELIDKAINLEDVSEDLENV